MSCYFVALASMFGTLGCAMLQETPPVEISTSRLTCEKNPAMVDGDLETVGIFEAHGTIQKGFRNQHQYQRQVVGSLKTETLIKLDTPTYIAYVEVYPASNIPVSFWIPLPKSNRQSGNFRLRLSKTNVVRQSKAHNRCGSRLDGKFSTCG